MRALTWNTRRAERLPSNWQTLREQVKRRANGQCQWVTRQDRCEEPGNECDHIIAGDDHSMKNLQWLCPPHHREKTIAEAQAARRLVSRKREPMRHPGLS